MPEKHAIIVPHWVLAALKRKQMSLVDVLDYSKVRQVLSVEDAATLLNLQQLYVAPFLQDNYFGYLLSSWESSANAEQKVELISTVVPLSYSEGNKESNLLRLKKVERSQDIFTSEQPDQQVFELVDFNREAFALVLNVGFADAVKESAVQMNLVKSILKLFYVYFKAHEVSSHNIFAAYVKLLNGVVWGRPAF